MATPKSAQAAYVEINEMLRKAQKLKNELDGIIHECEKIANRNDLVFEKRYLDTLPEVLNPDYYEVKEVTERYGRTHRTEMRKIFKDAKQLPKEALKDPYIQPGEDVEYSWIPSSLC